MDRCKKDIPRIIPQGETEAAERQGGLRAASEQGTKDPSQPDQDTPRTTGLENVTHPAKAGADLSELAAQELSTTGPFITTSAEQTDGTQEITQPEDPTRSAIITSAENAARPTESQLRIPRKGAEPPAYIESLNLATLTADKGNLALLRGSDGKLKNAVTVDFARRFGGVSRRAIERAVRKGAIECEGARKNRRIFR